VSGAALWAKAAAAERLLTLRLTLLRTTEAEEGNHLFIHLSVQSKFSVSDQHLANKKQFYMMDVEICDKTRLSVMLKILL